MRILFTICLVFTLFLHAVGQFQPSNNKIVNDLPFYAPTDHVLNKKSKTNPTTCTGDTLQYGRYKASSLQGLNISKGYAIGQYYDAPGEVTIDGFSFYAWQSSNNKDSVTIVCRLYEAGKDTIPTGTPIRQTTIKVDSTFNGGQLSTLLKRISFAPYTTSKPYIITVECDDSVNRVAVVLSNWSARDGDQEWLGCGTVAGVWYNFKNLNVGGTPLDCDALIEPHVTFKHFADFSFKNCYNYLDSVKFLNKSSNFTFNKMYNRYSYFNLDYICQRWNYGTNSFYYSVVNGGTKYNSAQNVKVTLISSIYGYTNGRRCDDTASYDASYQPAQVTVVGNTVLCSGDSLDITALGNAPMHWYKKDSDTLPFLIAPRYASPALTSNDTVFVRSVNGNCTSTKNRIVGDVKTTPQDPTVKDDYVCVNSSANLSANTDLGVMNWYTDSMATKPFYTGNIYKTSKLTSDTFMYVQAQNFNCTSNGKIKVAAYVSADFAPDVPNTVLDTAMCLLSSSLTLHATSTNGDTIKWYNVPSGGMALVVDENFTFTPTKEGQTKVYVEAYDGRCASTRLAINVQVNHFPKTSFDELNNICQGDTATLFVSTLKGSVNWYENKTDTKPFHVGSTYFGEKSTQSNTFYVEPFDAGCIDTNRYAISVNAIAVGVVSTDKNISTCRDKQLTLKANTTHGNIKWYDDADLDNLIQTGNNLTIANISADKNYWLHSEHMGCKSQPIKVTVKTIANTDATFDFQIINWRNVQFLARKGAQGTYKWNFDDNNNTKEGENITYIFSKDGTFNVRLIVENGSGCHDTSYRLITLSTLSMQEIDAKGPTIYPNPFSDKIQIASLNTIGKVDILIRDVVGKTIYHLQDYTDKQDYFLNTSQIKSGTYFITVHTDNQSTTRKLVKF